MSLKLVVLMRRLRARPDGAGATRLCGTCDEAALRAALAARAANPGATVTVIAAGPAGSEDPVLRWALAAGADRAMRVDDPALLTVDYQGLGRALGGAARSAGADLVLCGDRSEDEVQGAVGPAVAEALGIAHVTGAHDVKVATGAATLARREAGFVRTLRVKAPALLCVTSQGGPALPPHDKLDQGRTIQVLDLAAVGLSAAELKHRDRCLGKAHPVRVVRNATLVKDPDELVARLREDRLLG
jgi:electron transfer flavoprotein beta subunit